MTAVPSTRTWVAGEIVTDAFMNTTIRDVDNFLLARPIAELRQVTSQTLTSGTYAAIGYDAEDVDSANGHSNVTNNSRYTAVYAGWYDDDGGAGYATSSTGARACKWSVNGTDLNGSEAVGVAPTIEGQLVARPKKSFMNVTDFIELKAWQNTGGNLATNVSGAQQSNMRISWSSN